MLWMLLAACGGELGPGDVGYEDCSPVDLSPFGCDDVQTCCLQTTEVDQECRVVTEGGEELPCTDSACIAAVAEVVDSCATDPGTTPTGGGCDYDGTWDLDTVTCNSFVVDTWFDDFGGGTLDIQALPQGGCTAAVYSGDECVRIERWTVRGSAATFESVECPNGPCGGTLCDPPQFVAATLTGDLVTTGLLQGTVPTCTLGVVATWQ